MEWQAQRLAPPARTVLQWLTTTEEHMPHYMPPRELAEEARIKEHTHEMRPLTSADYFARARALESEHLAEKQERLGPAEAMALATTAASLLEANRHICSETLSVVAELMLKRAKALLGGGA